MGRPVVDLIGKQFGNLVVLRQSSSISGRIRWECECSCGNITYSDSGNLKKGHKKSCGCLLKYNKGLPRNLLGQRFERLIVIEFSHIDTGGYYNWKCRCDCGNVVVVRGDSLTTNNTKSCGCLKVEKIRESKNTRQQNGNWRGGTSIEYPIEWNNKLREFIRDRDGRKCQFPKCSYYDGFGNQKLSVHHIDGDKSHCHPSNLISLCRNHHSFIENNNPRQWDEYFYSITQDYEYVR